MTAIAHELEDPRQCWRTPRPLFEALHERWRFDVDGAADDSNHLLPRYWTARDNGVEQLCQSRNDALRVFVNPPYGDIWPWTDAARERWMRSEALTVLLLPARTDQRWFHELGAAMPGIVFLRGRVSFEAPPGVTASSNREPSILVVFGDCYPWALNAKTGGLLT